MNEAMLEQDQEFIRDPSAFTLLDNPLFRAHLKRAWRENAKQSRRMIRHAQALYDANSCTAVLLPE